MSTPLLFEELSLNDTWDSPGRTITETDLVQFACLTGDFDPLHMDHEHCKETPYGRPIAHGLLGLSYLAGLSSQYPRMKTTAFTRIERWQFLKPIYVGDTIHVRTEVIGLQEHGRRHGEVTWKRQLINQRSEVTQEGVFVTLVARGAMAIKYPERNAA
jgi:acyl dehydratase